MTPATAKKITVATVKSFIKKNRAALLVRVKSSFDGMQDMVDKNMDQRFKPAECRTWYDVESGNDIPCNPDHKNHMGLRGIWFCGGDTCNAFETETHRGFEVYNCCGNWFVAVAK